MKSVLISIQPKWVEKILSGEKTIEVRKTRPKIETPFKCYIYCTIGNGVKGDYLVPSGIQCGKAIGEFVCDRIEDFSQWQYDYPSLLRHIDLYAGTTKDYIFLNEYLKGVKKGYGWHITDLVIYDKPKELSEFRCVGQCCQWNKIEIKENVFGDYVDNCYDNSFCKTCCKYYNHDFGQCDKPYSHFLTRPPQSWCYVEGIDPQKEPFDDTDEGLDWWQK